MHFLSVFKEFLSIFESVTTTSASIFFAEQELYLIINFYLMFGLNK